MPSKPDKIELPEAFRTFMISHYGDQGIQWLNTLPDLLAECEKRWQVSISRTPVSNLSWNFIAPVRTLDGRDAMVKIGIPGKETFTEMETLKHFGGHGMVQLFEEDVELGAILIERITPGTSLKEIQQENDKKATEFAAPLIRDVATSVPVQHTLPSVANWAEVLGRVRGRLGKGPISLHMVEKAQHLFEALEATKPGDMLIHGDLHHDNIIFDENRGWFAIDPKGLIGDHAYNAARFMNNWWGTVPNAESLRARLDIFTTVMGYGVERIAGWAYVDYIIGNSWSVEGGHFNEINDTFITYTRLFDDILDGFF